MEMISGDTSKTELVMKKKGKHKSTTDIGVSLTPDHREKEESNRTLSPESMFRQNTVTRVHMS